MAQAEAQQKTFEEENLHSKIYQSCFSHEDQITERIDFLTLYAAECATKLSKDQLAELWVVLVANNKITFDKK